MKKIYLTFILAFMAFVVAVAQVGNYNGKLDITIPGAIQNLENQVIKITPFTQNYTITIKNFTFAMVLNKDIAINNVEIIAIDVDCDCEGHTADYKILQGTFPITIEGLQGNINIIINSGTIVNNVLDLDLTISVTEMEMLQVGVVFEGALATGIHNATANGVTIAGYYSITGAKLDSEPAKGIFIVKYSTGKFVKVVK